MSYTNNEEELYNIMSDCRKNGMEEMSNKHFNQACNYFQQCSDLFAKLHPQDKNAEQSLKMMLPDYYFYFNYCWAMTHLHTAKEEIFSINNFYEMFKFWYENEWDLDYELDYNWADYTNELIHTFMNNMFNWPDDKKKWEFQYTYYITLLEEAKWESVAPSRRSLGMQNSLASVFLPVIYEECKNPDARKFFESKSIKVPKQIVENSDDDFYFFVISGIIILIIVLMIL